MAKWLLLACSALLVLHGALVQGAGSCVLDGFNLTELDKGRYWNVTLRKNECLVPRGYTLRDVANCTVHFSVCKPLPRDICVNQTNSSTCEVVTTSDGNTYYFDIGSFQGNQGNKIFQPTGGTTTDVGFTTIRQGSTRDSAFCNSTFTTIMSFKCEPSAIWNHTRNNATVYVENSFNFEACLLEMQFNYSGACYTPPTLAPDRCRLDPYDFTGLKREDYYFATLPNDTCLPTNTTSCTVYFSFCRGLPLSIGEGCYEAAVCQAGMSPDGNFSISMGQLDEKTSFNEGRDTSTRGRFYMDVEGGDGTMCTGSDKGISTRVVLICDPIAFWTDQDLSNMAMAAQLDCEYTITIPYFGACLLPASSSAHAPTATPTRSSTGSSTSSNTKVSPNPTSTSHMHFSTSSHGTHTSSQTPVHSPTTGPPSRHTTPEDHHTTPEHPPTTQKKPPTQPTAKPDSSKIAGLTAGLVIFMLIALALLVLFIIAVFYIYKNRKTGEYERLQDSDKM